MKTATFLCSVTAPLAGLLAFAFHAASAQTPFTVPGAPLWQWQAPTPMGYDLTAIDALDDQTAVAVGYHGAALKTTDQGQSWQQLNLGMNYDLKAVSFVTPQLGWLSYNTPPPAGSGPYTQSGRGEVRRTTNGGQTWAVQYIGEPSDIEMQSMHFFSATEGYVFYYFNAPGYGRPARLRVTHNGGATWVPVPFFASNAKACQFVTPLLGYFTTGNLVSKTTDGGQTWTTITPPLAPGVVLNQLFFSDAQHGWLASSFGTGPTQPNFYRTTDGGATWTVVQLTPGSTGFWATYNLAFAPDGLHGVASGWATADGGLTWTLANTGSLYFGATWLLASGVGFAAGPYGQLHTTPDFGLTGRRGDQVLTSPFERVNFPDPSHGWAIGGYYPKTLVRTTDRGAHWQVQDMPSHAPGVQWLSGGLLAGSFPDADTAYVAGQEYVGSSFMPQYVLKTVNGGQHWARLPLTGAASINDLAFRDCRFGLVVGNQGEVWYTRNGGLSWQRGTSGTTQALRTISWADARTAYVRGDGSTFLKTTDGGQSWQPVPNTFFATFSSATRIQFLTAQVGYVTDGYLARTADGGQTWTFITSNTSPVKGVAGVSFPSAREGWAYGSQVFHTTNAGQTWTTQADVGMGSASGSFPDRYNGWVAGANGMLVHYSEKFIQADTTLTRLAYCAGESLSLPFSTTGSFAGESNFIVQLSNSMGRFRPGETRTVGSGPASPLAVTLPATLPPGSHYRLRVIQRDSLVLGADNGHDLLLTAPAPAATLSQLTGGVLQAAIPTGAAAPDHYEWEHDGQPLPAASTAQLAAPVPTGSYRVRACTAACCGPWSALVAVADSLPDLVVSTASFAFPNTGTGGYSGPYRNVTVTSTGSLYLNARLEVHGAMVVQSGGLFQGGPQTGGSCTLVTGPGSFTLEDQAYLVVYSPEGLSLTGATGSVQVTGSRSFHPGARYGYNSTGPQVTGPGLPARVRVLSTGFNGGAVTLSQPVAITELLVVAEANLNTAGHALTLLSDATGTALLHNRGSGRVVGNATVERYNSGTYRGPGYRHYSAPISNATIGSLATATWTPVVNPAYNTSATPPQVRPYPTVFGFGQNAVFDNGWASPTALTDAMTVGYGYTVQIPATEIVRFTGPLNQEQLSFGMSNNTSNDGAYYLLGNPYAAPLDWSTMTEGSGPFDNLYNVGTAVYVFEATGPYTGSYRTAVAGIGGSPVIASGQGFFVRTGPLGLGQYSFQLFNRNRVTTFSPANNTFRRSAPDTRPLLTLALRGASGPADPTSIYFTPAATPGFDLPYDAAKLPNTTGLNLASRLGNADYAINGLPLLGTQPLVLPLTLGVPAAGTYELAVDQLLNFAPGTTLYLRDAELGTLSPLAPGTRYAFTLAATSAPGRFTVEFRPAGALATAAQVLEAQVHVFPNPARAASGVTIAAPARARVTVFNTLGQQVMPTQLVGSSASLHLPTAGLAAGLYVLRIQDAAGDISRRLVLE
jgi:photosystem II stability/assembly factor-like uncharacterized protein